MKRLFAAIEIGQIATASFQAAPMTVLDNPEGYGVLQDPQKLLRWMEHLPQDFLSQTTDLILVGPQEFFNPLIEEALRGWSRGKKYRLHTIGRENPEMALRNAWASEDRMRRSQANSCGIIVNYSDCILYDIERGYPASNRTIVQGLGAASLMEEIGASKYIGNPEDDPNLVPAHIVLRQIYSNLDEIKSEEGQGPRPHQQLEIACINLAEKVERAFAAMSDLFAESNCPILVGGVGGGFLWPFFSKNYAQRYWKKDEHPGILSEGIIQYCRIKNKEKKPHGRKKTAAEGSLVTTRYTDKETEKFLKNLNRKEKNRFIQAAVKHYIAYQQGAKK